MPTVYVVQDTGRYNIVTAAKFGALKALLPARAQLQLDATEAVEHLRQKLIEYNDEDCLLCIGDPAAIGIAMAIATFYNGGKVNVLKFDRQANDYYKLPVDLTQFFNYPITEIDTTAREKDEQKINHSA
jgi:hypothetical protein